MIVCLFTRGQVEGFLPLLQASKQAAPHLCCKSERGCWSRMLSWQASDPYLWGRGAKVRRLGSRKESHE